MKSNNIQNSNSDVSAENGTKPYVVCSAVGIPCEICGDICIVEQVMIPEEEIVTPVLCGKCYNEYYPEYLQSLRTGYRL